MEKAAFDIISLVSFLALEEIKQKNTILPTFEKNLRIFI